MLPSSLRHIVFILFVFNSSTLLGQINPKINGVVTDTLGSPIIGANILVFFDNDSIHYVSHEDGTFTIAIRNNKIIFLKVSAIGYSNYQITLSTNKLDSLQVRLKPTYQVLKEIEIKGKTSPYSYKEDTILFKVSQFIRNEDETIQEILERLPGLSVDVEGNIMVMGQPVNKIKINGIEYYASNIKVLASLIPAKLINQIQLIDDYGTIANLTGIKAGKSEKVLNLTTESDLKKFSSLLAGGGWGTNDRYSLITNYLVFTPKHHLLVNLFRNNVSIQNGEGNLTGGEINLMKEFKKNISFNFGINGRRLDQSLLSKTLSQTITSEGLLNDNITSFTNSVNDHFKYNSEIKLDLDSNNYTIVRLTGENSIVKIRDSTILFQDGFQKKNNYLQKSSYSKSDKFSGEVIMVHRFSNKSDLLAFNAFVIYNKDRDNIDLNNHLQYFDNSNIRDSLFHEIILRLNKKYNISSQLSFTHKINDKKNIELKYSLLSIPSQNIFTTYLKDSLNVITQVDSLSSSYRYNINQHDINAIYVYKRNSFSLLIGTDMRIYSLNGNNKRMKIFPIFNCRIKVNYKAELHFSYKGETLYPTYEQVSLTPNYSDILNPIIGNFNLKPATLHTLNFEFSRISKSFFYANIAASNTMDNIVDNVLLVKDASNSVRQETHFLNTDINYGLSNMLSWRKEIFKSKSEIRFDESSTVNIITNYYNNTPGKSTFFISNMKATLNLKFKILEINPQVLYQYNQTKYNFLNNNTIVEIQLLNLKLGSLIQFSRNIKLQVSGNRQIDIANTSNIGKVGTQLNADLLIFCFKRKIIMNLLANNVFNSTSNISQSVNNNTTTRGGTNIIGRYFMVAINYRLN